MAWAKIVRTTSKRRYTVCGKKKWENWLNVLLAFFKRCVFTWTKIVILPRTVWGCQEPIFGDFQSYRLENKSIWVVFRVEFDGDVRLFLAPPKSMFLSIFSMFFAIFSFSKFFIKILIFFFKQKTAYEIPLRLVGSEMCIRDRCNAWGWCDGDLFHVNKCWNPLRRHTTVCGKNKWENWLIILLTFFEDMF